MCDCRTQVAGQQQFSLTPAIAADRVTLSSNGYELRDLSEPARIHFPTATALGSPTVSFSSRRTHNSPSSTPRASAPDDRRVIAVAVRKTGASTNSRLGSTPANQSNLAVPFSLCCPAFPHPGLLVERFSDTGPCSGELQKSDELQSVRHMHPTGSGLRGNVVSVDCSRRFRQCNLRELPRCRRKVVHEEGNADQCPPTGGKPDRHR
ncbi:MAG: hypothetical protein JWN70_980 [Planctomycetaceae bacterium]|nr:hypothetical protein [Planctomycetaceae bacterium]